MMSFLNIAYIIAILQFTAYSAFNIHEKRAQIENGFDCGKVFFSDHKVQDVLSVAITSVGKDNVRPYIGRLYGYMANYFTLPIFQKKSYLGKKKIPEDKIWSKSTYQVVMDSQGGFIDVLVRITNNDFAKCWRVSDFHILNDIDQSNGYQCGEKFISTEDLLLSAGHARKHMGKGLLYPILYEGRLYGRELGLVMWPIYRGPALYRSPIGPGGPYFILVDPTGHVVDVIVRTFENDYVKCFKSRNFPSSSTTDVEGRLLAQPPKSGFTCKEIFFHDRELSIASEMAKNARSRRKANVYPLKYDGPPFNSPCLLWPIRPSVSQLGRGRLPPYRLVLTLDYQVLDVVMQKRDIIKRCERTITAGGFLDHDKNDYDCEGTIFYQDELVSAAKTACNKKDAYDLKFPQRYEGEEFEIEGPYLMYPILKGLKFTLNPGLHRMVMNSDCVVVGAVTVDRTTGRLKKCKATAMGYALYGAEFRIQGTEQ